MIVGLQWLAHEGPVCKLETNVLKLQSEIAIGMDPLSTIDNFQTSAQRKQVPRPVDLHVGSRIQLRRVILGMSQTKLAEKLGLTFQQVQKYEHGVNRVSASRLFELAQALDVPIGFFFDDLPGNEIFGGQFNCGPVMQRASGDVTGKPETQDLLRAYYAIPDVTIRRRILELVKCLAAGDGHLESSRDDAPPDKPVGEMVLQPVSSGIDSQTDSLSPHKSNKAPPKRREAFEAQNSSPRDCRV